MESETDQTERHGCHDFEVRARGDPLRELPREGNMLTDHRPQSLDTIAPDHEPQLERTESAPELNAPIAIVDDLGIVRRPEVFGSGLEGPEKGGRVANVVRRAVEVGQHPFVGIEDEAVRALDSAGTTVSAREPGPPCRRMRRPREARDRGVGK